MKIMKVKYIYILALSIVGLLFTKTTNAQGFSGAYAPVNWTTSAPVGGTVNTAGAPASITMNGPNSFSAGNLDYTITITCPTTISFHWNVVHFDCGFDEFFYGVNGTFTQLADCSDTGTVTGVTVVPGDVFTFRVHTDDGFAGGLTSTISNFNHPPIPNDVCSNAIAISPGSFNGTTICAGAETEVACGGAINSTGGGVWYKYTPICSGSTLVASLCGGASFDTRLRVFSGACGSLVCVAGNDNFCSNQSETSWTGTAGVTYSILVYGADATQGNFTLNFSEIEAVAPVADASPLPDLTSTCTIYVTTAPTATDNCAGPIIGTTTDPTTYATPGSYVVHWTYDDGNGNTSTQTQNVIVSTDPVAPTIACQNDTTLSNDPGICGATVYYQAPACLNPLLYTDQADDNVPDNGYFMEDNLPQYMSDDFLVPDGVCWNIEHVTANVWENPMGAMSNITLNIHADAGGVPGAIISTQNLTSADWTSTVVGSSGAYTISNFDFTLPTPVTGLCGAPGGTTYWLSFYDNFSFFQVAWSVTNNVNGNYAVYSTSSPTGPWNMPFPPIDLVFSLSGSQPGAVSDNCPECPAVVQTAGLPSGSLFPVGTTTNSFKATDASGNSSVCSFDVIVTDSEAPTPDAVQTFSFNSGPINVSILDYQTAVDSILVSGLPTSLASGNIGSACININHTYDADITIHLVSPLGTVFDLSSNNGSFNDNYTSTCFDMSAATSIVSGFPPFTGSFIPEGAGGFDVFNGEDPNGYWKLTIFDGAGGDQGTLTEFDLTFSYSDQLPSVNAACSATLTPPTATDNCDGPVTATTSDPTTYSSDGVYSVQWSFTDLTGNTFIQTQTVTIEDSVPPVPDMASLPIVSDSCSVTLTNIPTATDSCEGTINGTTIDALTYNVAGVYTVTWTYNDGRGNTSTQTQTVVVTDNHAPVPDQAILPNVVGNCIVSIPSPPTATDNCSGTIMATTTDPTTYNLIGTFFVIWHFDDGNGNTWTQNQTVVVNPCLGIEDPSGQWSALVYPNPSSGIFTLSLSEMPNENTQIRLVDALGQILYSGISQGQIQQFDFSHLASANYYLLVTSDHGQISKPIIIRQGN